MSDPGDEWNEDPTQARDRAITEAETAERSEYLHDLAGRVDTDATREAGIKALQGVLKDNEPPERPWIKRL